MREDRWSKARRVAQERSIALWTCRSALLSVGIKSSPTSDPSRFEVLVTRVGKGSLDEHDNVRGALKFVVDGIADAFGMRDADPRLKWSYAQRKGPYAVEIEVRRIGV